MKGVGGANSDDRHTDAKISVWWDLENCKFPKNAHLYKISSIIHSALNQMNCRGPVEFFCYGDPTLLPEPINTALIVTAMNPSYAPSEISIATMLVDMVFWAIQNPAPATILLINRNYNTLLAARPQNISAGLLGAAKKVWLWTSLAAGGPPLSDRELQQLRNSNSDDGELQQLHVSNGKSSSETLQVPVSNGTQTQQQEGPNSEVQDGNMNISGHASGKLERKCKRKRKLERKPEKTS